MPEYHVGCGPISGEMKREHREWYGYEWSLKDGRKVTLGIKIEEGHKENG